MSTQGPRPAGKAVMVNAIEEKTAWQFAEPCDQNGRAETRTLDLTDVNRVVCVFLPVPHGYP
jgi:hypothetical protein